MLCFDEYVRRSLELNLFFARIMKEHLLFMEAAFVPKDYNLSQLANELKVQFSCLLAETVALANGMISKDVLLSGELVTPYTLNAEMATQFYTGIPIEQELTMAEQGLEVNMAPLPYNPVLEQRINMLNHNAIALANQVASFKLRVLNDVLACRLFTHNYPLLLDHIRREALFYIRQLTRLQNRDAIDTEREALEFEVFWNRIMAEHAKFIRGFLDPTEENLFNLAHNFANEFDELTKEATEALTNTVPFPQVTCESLKATESIRDFKEQGTQGLLQCTIKSVILPLLGDHVLREANHYLRLLRRFRTA
ncbi:MAG: hypothetical protein JM58_19355 [Peptococcaceae bacterium BICA1-8]|nr:MAG: hypothetical protein JM58_19355 [Peptococcaceae bacterium BICA1-8]